MNIKTDTKFWNRVYDKLFQSVGFKKFNRRFTNKNDWYLLRTWTAAQEKEFKEWFVKEVRKQFGFSKKIAEKEANWFVFDVGWKLEE